MLDRKLDSIRQLVAESAQDAPLISYNPGTMSDPLPAVERAMSAFRRRVRGHPQAGYEKCRAILEDYRIVAAEVFGGQREGWAIADGHTATIDRVASTLAQLFPDRPTVVSTDSEHIGGLGAFTADPRFNVVEVPPDRLLDTPGQIFFLSHLTYDTNRDNTAEILALTRRADSPLVIVDGNQALGQVDVDVGVLNAHAYIASAHKWLGGPHGAGLLYLRGDVIESWPSPFRAGEPLCQHLPIGRWEPRGGQDFSRIAGLAAAIRAYQVHAKPGRAVREHFISALTQALGGRVRVLRSSAPQGRVVAFEIDRIDVYPVYRRLADRGVSVKCIKKPGKCSETGRPCLEILRVGFPWWTDTDHIDEAVVTLSAVVREVDAAPGSDVTAPASAALRRRMIGARS